MAPTRRRGILSQYLRVLLLWNPLLCLSIVAVFQSGGRPFRMAYLSLLIATVSASVSFLVVVLWRAVERRIARARQRSVRQHGTGWYFAQALCALPLGLFLAFEVAGLLVRLAGGFWERPGLLAYRSGLFLGTLIAGLFFLWKDTSDAHEAMRLSENQRLQAQLAALTAQMNPHLLFNALNTVASLIPTDPATAEHTLVRLAELYRGVLASSQKPTHTLDDELALCQAYLDVEQARFGDRLTAMIKSTDVDPRSIQVPVLVIQPLVENAVTHGLSPRAPGGKIQITARSNADQLEISVVDDGIGLGNSRRAGAGLSVATCRKRLELAYGESGSLDLLAVPSGGTQALVKLPLRPRQES